MKKISIGLLLGLLLTGLLAMPIQSLLIEDTEAPEITLVNPTLGYFHFSGIKLFPLNAFSRTMGFGGFRLRPVQANITDNEDEPSILNVSLYIDGELERIMEYNEDSELFEGKWIGPGLGTYTMNVTASDTSGNTASEEWDIWYFCFIPEP